MTQDEIIEMAQECNLIGMRPHLDGIYSEALVAFAKALIRRLQISCLGLDPVDPLRLLVDDVVEALTQPEQEPVAWMDADGNVSDNNDHKCFPIPLYTAPPQRTWVGLEGEEIRNLWEEATKPDRSTMTMVTSFAKSIEAKLKQLNT
jgi:hypothetical protein